MQLTPKAVEMKESLRNLLAASDALCATPGFDPSTSDRVFKLLVTDVGTIVFLPPLLTRIASEGSKLTLRAAPLDSRHFELKLEPGEADLALGAFAQRTEAAAPLFRPLRERGAETSSEAIKAAHVDRISRRASHHRQVGFFLFK
jgi:DNA-binding transcriptional LysR family regulator